MGNDCAEKNPNKFCEAKLFCAVLWKLLSSAVRIVSKYREILMSWEIFLWLFASFLYEIQIRTSFKFNLNYIDIFMDSSVKFFLCFFEQNLNPNFIEIQFSLFLWRVLYSNKIPFHPYEPVNFFKPFLTLMCYCRSFSLQSDHWYAPHELVTSV